jgi:diguanylate cyclase (GGDEF)-like protein/PAS domain S-box-containing protein
VLPRFASLRFLVPAALIGLLIIAAYEGIDGSGIFGLAGWQTHILGVAFCVISVSSFVGTLVGHERAAALKLRAERDLSTALINSLPAAVALYDSSGIIQRWNSNFLGYSEPELLNTHMQRIVAADQWPIMKERFKEALTAGFGAGEFELIAKNGARIPCVVRVARVVMDKKTCVLGVAIDISDRKEAERKLAASEEKYRQVIDNIPEVVWSADMRGAVNFVSPQVDSIIGISQSAFYRKGIVALADSVHPEDRDAVENALKMLLSTGQPIDLEYRMAVDPTGIIWVHNHAFSVERSSGERLVMGLLSDVTIRREREKNLRRLASIVESLDQAVIGLSPDGLISDWNEVATKTYGFAPGEVLGKDLSILYPSDRVHEAIDLIDRLRRGEKVEPFETRRVTKSGAVLDVSVIPSAIRDGAGKLIGFVSVATNISHLVQARESLRLQSAALEAAANGILITDATGRIEWANPAFTSLTGYNLEEAIGRNPRELIKSGKHDAAFYKDLWTTILAGRVWSGELINRKKDGRLYSEEMTIGPVRSPEGKITHFIAVKQDVSQRKAAEDALRAAEEQYRAVFENAVIGIFQTTPDGTPLMVNQALAEIHGYRSPEKLLAEITNIPKQLFWDFDRFKDMARVIELEGQVQGAEVEVLRRDGARRTVLVNLRGIRNSDGSIACHHGTLADITERKLAEDQAHFLAYNDTLTGLPNRALLQDRLRQALAAASRANHKVAVAFLDLDRFKDINDSLGHSVGDLLLQQVARRLCAAVRQECTIARIGGDEFILVMPNILQLDEVITCMGRILDAMRSEFPVAATPLHVSCSIGVSIFPDNGCDAESLIKNADAAMYEAKESGRDNFQFFAAEMNRRAVDRLTLENKLRHAIELDQFSLVYQPQVSVSTGEVTGVEALLRWQEPDLGSVSPERFVPVAESAGLIVPIGDWILRRACRNIRAWQHKGLGLGRVAVNVSAAQLRRRDFLDRVRAIVEEAGIGPHFLEFEITESIFTANALEARDMIAKLRDFGISIAVDDFGTGYSNLKYLSDFRFSRLKIDRSFVQDAENSARSEAIVKTIIRMAKSLELGVVAEGVETASQLALLHKNKCDEAQGFYFSHAVTAEEIPDLVAGMQELNLVAGLQEN